MSHPQPPQRQPTQAETRDYRVALRNTAIVGVVAFPILIALPPRKLDFYTFALTFGTYYCGNHLSQEYTGRTITENVFGVRRAQPILQELPSMDLSSAQMEELRERRQEELRSARKELHDKGKDWAVERQKEVEEAVDEGKGIGDMIMDQISEVVNWGKKKGDD